MHSCYLVSVLVPFIVPCILNKTTCFLLNPSFCFLLFLCCPTYNAKKKTFIPINASFISYSSFLTKVVTMLAITSMFHVGFFFKTYEYDD
jgi:hypothetical protein